MNGATGPSIATKLVELIFVVDVSGSMAADAKIQSLNAALEEALPSLRETAGQDVGVEALVRVLTFADRAEWVAEDAVPLSDFWWHTLHAQPRGLTEMGAALDALLPIVELPHPLPPAIVLLTDGMPTDTVHPTFDAALASLDAHPVGRAAARAAIAIGADADHEALERFLAPSGTKVLDAHNPQRLAEVVRVAGTSVIRSASEPIW